MNKKWQKRMASVPLVVLGLGALGAAPAQASTRHLTYNECQKVVKQVSRNAHCVAPRDKRLRLGGAYMDGLTTSNNTIYVRTGLSQARTKYVVGHEWGHVVANTYLTEQGQAVIKKATRSNVWYPRTTGTRKYFRSGNEVIANAWAKCKGYGNDGRFASISCGTLNSAYAKSAQARQSYIAAARVAKSRGCLAPAGHPNWIGWCPSGVKIPRSTPLVEWQVYSNMR